jgi:hypothetical protein
MALASLGRGLKKKIAGSAVLFWLFAVRLARLTYGDDAPYLEAGYLKKCLARAGSLTLHSLILVGRAQRGTLKLKKHAFRPELLGKRLGMRFLVGARLLASSTPGA